MAPIHAIYEKGVLRPVEPISLPEGAQVEVLILTSASAENNETSAEILDRIAALPLEGNPGLRTSQEYESILYPDEGDIP
ncbi:MAG: antitoxin family protein [Anaerolineae bacterium]